MFYPNSIPGLFFPGVDTAVKAYKVSCHYTRSATKRLQSLTKTPQARDLSSFLGFCLIAHYHKVIQTALPEGATDGAILALTLVIGLNQYTNKKYKEAQAYKNKLIEIIMDYVMAIKENKKAIYQADIPLYRKVLAIELEQAKELAVLAPEYTSQELRNYPIEYLQEIHVQLKNINEEIANKADELHMAVEEMLTADFEQQQQVTVLQTLMYK